MSTFLPVTDQSVPVMLSDNPKAKDRPQRHSWTDERRSPTRVVWETTTGAPWLTARGTRAWSPPDLCDWPQEGGWGVKNGEKNQVLNLCWFYCCGFYMLHPPPVTVLERVRSLKVFSSWWSHLQTSFALSSEVSCFWDGQFSGSNDFPLTFRVWAEGLTKNKTFIFGK